MTQQVLVTGGAGYIGSHTTVELLRAGHEVVVVDNLCQSSRESLRRVEELCGRAPEFHEVDVRDRGALDRVFRSHEFDAVVHFAALKAVGESTEIPLQYYDNNVVGTLVLLGTMKEHGVRRLVFSSSCTVYGQPEVVPVTEAESLGAASPYGRTKLMMEDIMRDLAAAESDWKFLLLRYFNPVGAHPSGRIGEDPRGVPLNLMPYVMQVAVGTRPFVRVFGSDYATEDGTGVRDYIHVVDLALGHVAALERIDGIEGCRAINLGTGKGYSVLDVIAAAERALGRPIAREIVERRPGDVACVYADPALATSLLGWEATRDLEEMAADHLRWQSQNPHGYDQPLPASEAGPSVGAGESE